jgi:hypothetical protein
VALVVAPAGFGKTTLLEQYARTRDSRVARYRADPADAATGGTARRVTAALRAALGVPPLSDRAEADADPLAELAVAGPTDLLLLIDNVDCLIGTPGELTIERLLANRPPGMKIVIAGRRMPELNLMRHEVSRRPDVLGADQLRFRTWEVERLLTGVYAEPLPPDEVALLTRRTGGWAAGLTMFHLSTRGRPLSVRRRAVAALSGRWAAARDYLARNLLAGLSDDVRDFLVHTCVFDLLTGERCDRLLGTAGSDQRLDELAHRYGLPITVDGGNTYQYHQVLRSHLGAVLVELLGEAEARHWHARAAELLVTEGAYAEAVRSYARAGDWPAVRRLLARVGGDVVDGNDRPWDDELPGWLVAEDPWLVYAEARRRLGHGQFAAAIDGFRQAEALFGDDEGRQRCLRERRIAAIWLTDQQPARTHWSSWLRAATRRHPTVVAGEALALGGTEGELVRLAADLLAGNVAEALRHPTGGADRLEVSPAALALRLLRTALRLAVAAAALPVSAPVPGLGATAQLEVELDHIAEEAESVGVPWLARLTRAARALGPDPDAVYDAYAVAAECERRADRWGHLLATTIACLHEQRLGRPDPRRLARLVPTAGNWMPGSCRPGRRPSWRSRQRPTAYPTPTSRRGRRPPSPPVRGYPGCMSPRRSPSPTSTPAAATACCARPRRSPRQWACRSPSCAGGPAPGRVNRPRRPSRRPRPRWSPSPNRPRRCRSAASAGSTWRSPGIRWTPPRYAPGPARRCGCSRCTPGGWCTARSSSTRCGPTSRRPRAPATCRSPSPPCVAYSSRARCAASANCWCAPATRTASPCPPAGTPTRSSSPPPRSAGTRSATPATGPPS